MLFMHTHEWIFDKSPYTSEPKTATSRIVKPEHTAAKIAMGTALEFMPVGYGWGDIVAVRRKGRDIYALQKDYAVQPARGKVAIGRITITGICRYDVRNITPEQVRCEGLGSAYSFLMTWTKMYDNTAWNANQKTDFSDGDESGMINSSQGWMSWLKGQRPAKFYEAWYLTFEQVRLAPAREG